MSNTHDCVICLDVIDINTTGQTTMTCGHTYHLSCISAWITKNPSCPVCRTKAVDKEIPPINTTNTKLDEEYIRFIRDIVLQVEGNQVDVFYDGVSRMTPRVVPQQDNNDLGADIETFDMDE